MAKISDAQVGDELLCYMKLGLAIGLTTTGDGRPYRFSPSKARRARAADLTKFIGFVLSHDLDAHTLRLQVSRVGHKKNSLPEDPPTVVELHYSAFKRVQRYSKYAHEATYQYVGGRPSNYEGLGAQRKPYRTLENLELF